MSILPHWLRGKEAPKDSTVPAGAGHADAQRKVDELLELARLAEESGDLPQAILRISDAIRLDPGCAIDVDDTSGTPDRKTLYARAALDAGIALIAENRWEDAAAALQRAAHILPGWASPYVNLAYVEMRRGNIGAAVALYREAIARDPDSAMARSYLLFAMDLSDAIAPEENFLEHRQFGEWLSGVTRRTFRDHANSPDPTRILRVGYVSADFRIHPVAQFLEPILGDHDPSQIEFFCYSNTRERDELTSRLEGRFARNWRDVAGLTDDEFADIVIGDEIDILVDLSGHTAGGRLPVFAQKPAPIQVAWLGYLNTTGLKAMDYRLVDRHTDPVGVAESCHTERLMRLPDSQWAYWPMIEMPLLPKKSKSKSVRVVFGSQNQFAKVSDRCIELWARIMARVPHAHLRIASVPPGNGANELLRRLEGFGIPGDRVEAVPRVPIKQYLEAFNRIDVALDSMPYNGATTALDTLWMGVPIAALVGERSVSRGTYSVLKTLGRDDLIAETPEEYVELNVRLATDADWRNELHRTLRDQLRRSPLMDISRFTENLEVAYREMWRNWCALERQRPVLPNPP